MPSTSLVLHSLILSSLMRHHRFVVLRDVRRSGFDSATDAAFSEALSRMERMLRLRRRGSASAGEGHGCSDSVSEGTWGVDVDADPLDADAAESWEDLDCIEEVSRAEGMGGSGSFVGGRWVADMCGLCAADGATDGTAEGRGLGCWL